MKCLARELQAVGTRLACGAVRSPPDVGATTERAPATHWALGRHPRATDEELMAPGGQVLWPMMRGTKACLLVT